MFTLRLLSFLVLTILALGNISDAELRKMKIKDLKKFLSDRGVVCNDCFEKGDFVAKAIVSKSIDILPSKLPKQVNTEPIDKRWGKVATEVCDAITQLEGYCKALKSVVEGSFFQYGRKFKRELSVTEPHLAQVSFTDPYFKAGKLLLTKTVQYMVKENTKKNEQIRKKYENDFIPWLRDCALENTNTMYEILGTPSGSKPTKKR
eukprot:NODE_4526_length_774_cov_480.774343_g4367_i0.p1 GENE.NODE_4526_length_774_cov_480.774343_g4367_i0~~NODE_4526_length_774_cov_480.774343_g4367_i0.p1  ORF type:complete len:205 (-),score=52.39 NODE_4526_length_774_cov_480.774343_g4367_i0:97-711(-)